MKEFIKLLKMMRKTSDISQNQLAMVSGFTAAYISKLEAGKYDTILISTLLALARAFEPEKPNVNRTRAAQMFFECFLEK